MSEAVFSDVIDVSFDTAALEQSLNAFVDLYRTKMEELGSINPVSQQFSDLVNVSAIKEGLTEVQGQLKGLVGAFLTGFADIASASGAAGAQVATGVKASLEETDSAVSKSAKYQLEQLSLIAKEGPEQYAAFATAAAAALSEKLNPSIGTTVQLQKNLYTFIASGGEAAFEELDAAQRQWFTNYSQVIAGAEEKIREFREMQVREISEAWDEAHAADVEWVAARIELINEASEEFTQAQQKQVSTLNAAYAEDLTRFKAYLVEKVNAGKLSAEEFEALSGQEAEFAQRSVMARLAAEKTATAEMEVEYKKRAAASQFQDAESPAFQQSQMRMIALEKSANAQMLADFKESIEQKIQAGKFSLDEFAQMNEQETVIAQEAVQAQVRMQQQATAQMNAEFVKRAEAFMAANKQMTDAAAKAAKEIKDAQAAAAKASTLAETASYNASGFIAKLGSQFKETLSELPEMIASLVVIQTLWMGIGAAIGAVSGLVSLVTGELKDGYEYLTNLQQKSAELQAVIAQSVKLSQDQATNFKLAGEAATILYQNAQDGAIKYGLEVDSLTKAVKAFIDAGGTPLTKNLADAEQAAILLSAAIQGSGKGAEQTRSAVSEIPKLLDGTISKQSKVLETLGLSVEEWNKIVAQAKLHGDLTEQLAARLAPYIAVAEEAAKRQGALAAQAKLTLDRIVAMADKPLWDQMTKALEDIGKFLNENKEAIEQTLAPLGELAADFVRALESTIKLVESSKEIRGILTLLVDLAFTWVGPLDAVLKTWNFIVDAALRLKGIIFGTPPPPAPGAPSSDAAHLAAGFGSKTPDDHADLAAKEKKDLADLQRQYKDLALQQTTASDKERQDITLNLTARRISADAAAAQMKDANDREFAAQNKLIAQQKEKAAAYTHLDASDKGKFDEDIQLKSDELVKKHDKENFDAKKANLESINKLHDKDFAQFQKNVTNQERLNAQLAEKDREGIELSLAARKISADEAADALIKANAKEYASQLELLNSAKAIGDAYKGIPAEAKRAFDENLSKQLDALTAKHEKENFEAEKARIEEQNRLSDEDFKKREAALTKFNAHRLSEIRAAVKAGTLTETEGAFQELLVATKTHEDRIALLKEESAAVGANDEQQAAIILRREAADEAYTSAVEKNASDRVAALAKELTERDALVAAEGKARIAAAQIEVAEARLHHESAIARQQDEIKLLKVYEEVTKANLMQITSTIAQRMANGEVGKSIQDLINKQLELQAAYKQSVEASRGAQATFGLNDPISQSMADTFDGLKTIFGDASDHFTDFGKDFATTVEDFSKGIQAFAQAGSKISADLEKGNIGGAVGDSISTAGGVIAGVGGMFKKLGEAPGIIGAVAGAVGGMVSMISGFFTAAAKRTAEDIKKQFDASVQAYQQGSATLQNTIAAVEQERADAIARLSNQKGGQDQLAKLLPTLDNEIATLKAQQAQIISNFNTSLEGLRLNSDALTTALSTWTQINKQVQDYVNAGGDAAEAAQFLSLSLEKMKESAASSLSSGENDAIQQALKLNELLVQRKNLTDAYNKSKFETLNADALERRASNAVTVGMNQAAADKAYKASLDDLNTQITTAQTEVNMYAQIYNIAADTATLKKESAALEIANLATTISQLKSYAKIYEGIYKTPTGTYATDNGAGTGVLTPGAASQNTTIGNLNVNVTTTGPIDASALANTLQTALKDRGRYGAGTYVLTPY